MTPSAIFDVSTRLLGLAILYRAISVLPELVIAASNVIFGSSAAHCIDPLLTFVVLALASVWLIVGAPPLAKLAQLNRH
ncbi:MAG: hypothetical protein RI897_2624 [Verrucomicrobiota bacterium]|jgi:hypothetical protein